MRFAPALCPQARDDQYSDTLNYYLGATVRQSSLYRGRRVPSLTLFTSVASEYNAFRRRTTAGALFSLASRPGARLPSTISYQFEVGRTDASPVVFCAIFSACDDTSRARLTADNRPLGALGYAVVRNRADDPLNPTAGSTQRLTLRHASAFTGSHATQRFNKLVLDASWYRRVGGGSLLVAHAQLGTVFGGAPPQERLFAGGPTTVRGFRQNELGPAVYLVSKYETIYFPGGRDSFYLADPDSVRAPDRTIPAGGNTLIVGNLELQLRSPFLRELLQYAIFADAGEVWNRGVLTAETRRFRVTPGAGLRVRTLFGVVRLDLGYNPYDLPTGAAYAIVRGTGPDGRQQEELYCVSPGNNLRILPPTPGRVLPRQETGDCAGTFTPPAQRGFLRRINPSIWIGNAF
jgi:outer membrane protein insertion porin family/translocation and assembly module TamA